MVRAGVYILVDSRTGRCERPSVRIKEAGECTSRAHHIIFAVDRDGNTGTFFVADGYGGTCVARFDKNFNTIRDWVRLPVDPDDPGPYELWSFIASA